MVCFFKATFSFLVHIVKAQHINIDSFYFGHVIKKLKKTNMCTLEKITSYREGGYTVFKGNLTKQEFNFKDEHCPRNENVSLLNRIKFLNK